MSAPAAAAGTTGMKLAGLYFKLLAIYRV